VGHLIAFRAAAVRRRAALRWAALALAGLTATAAVLPAFLPGAETSPQAADFRALTATGMAGFLLLAVVSAVASGGGRELIGRDQAVAFPVSPATDHLGALVLAPLNIAWLLQSWALLVSISYGLGPGRLAPALVVMLLWLALATATGQAVAWLVEAVRRRRFGIVAVRVLLAAVALTVLAVQLAGHLADVLDRLPTLWLFVSTIDGVSARWALAGGLELVALVAVVVLGVVPAGWAARRPPLDEARAESESHAPLPMPRSDLLALLRLDRASVWRSVPMRRGLAVLAVGPGVVALLGDLPWSGLAVLPGLVASGGALLFGVNTWCLDGRGLLWRENLPVDPGLVFTARALVVAEFLGLASLVTVLLASARAGLPGAAEAAAVACATVVVIVQVVGAAMRWSERRPFAVDLRSARATPAPPAVMVGYSSRLALSTTMTGLVFSGLARLPHWQPAVVVAVPFLLWSGWRLLRARRRWLEPAARARVVVAVSA
jgi:hypothetical protein